MYAHIIDALNARFAARFTSDGEDYLYRTNSDATPIRVTARGRQLLIDGFYDRSGWVATGAIAALATVLLCLYIAVAAPFPRPDYDTTYLGFFALIAVSTVVGGWFDLRDFPQRALFRGAVSAKLLDDRWFRYIEYRTTWIQLLCLVFIMTPKTELVDGKIPKDIATLWFVGIGYCFIIYIAIMKLRIRRTALLPLVQTAGSITDVA